jgi:hypothetical protein
MYYIVRRTFAPYVVNLNSKTTYELDVKLDRASFAGWYHRTLQYAGMSQVCWHVVTSASSDWSIAPQRCCVKQTKTIVLTRGQS